MSAATTFVVGHLYQNRHNHRVITIVSHEISDTGSHLIKGQDKKTKVTDWYIPNERRHWIDYTLLKGIGMNVTGYNIATGKADARGKLHSHLDREELLKTIDKVFEAKETIVKELGDYASEISVLSEREQREWIADKIQEKELEEARASITVKMKTEEE